MINLILNYLYNLYNQYGHGMENTFGPHVYIHHHTVQCQDSKCHYMVEYRNYTCLHKCNNSHWINRTKLSTWSPKCITICMFWIINMAKGWKIPQLVLTFAFVTTWDITINASAITLCSIVIATVSTSVIITKITFKRSNIR